jgi:proline iminopeptidase
VHPLWFIRIEEIGSMKFRAKSVCLQAVVLAALFAPSCPGAEAKDELYPLVEPLRTGYLRVSDRHELYWEVCGREDGVPVIVLHGGPGASAGPDMRRFFDPDRFKIILFDQRGAGRSRPIAEWRENTTQLLVEDINTLRGHLGVTGKAMLFGGSWGTTLAVAYAEEHPELVGGMVLRGVFLASRGEIDHFYHGGTAAFFPENFAKLQGIMPRPESRDYPRQLFAMIESGDKAARSRAIKGWAYYEIRMARMSMTAEYCREIVEKYDMTAFSVLENYYMMNGCFLEEGQLLRDTGRIAHIPTFIVNGRYDVICPPSTAHALASRLETVRLELTIAGHSQSEPENTAALVRGVRWVAERIDP